MNAASTPATPPKRVERVIRDRPLHWVGDGFRVRSLLSYAGGNLFDPFLLLDHAEPHRFAPNPREPGVGEHPHRGFETVTLAYRGELAHRDSAGHGGTLGPGDVQWMTAASGLVHEEFHSERFAREGGVLEMVQLWVNLPAARKGEAPGYQHLPAAGFPVVPLPGGAGSVRVVAGAFAGITGPARTATPVNLWDADLRPGVPATLPLPAGHTSLLLVRAGRLRVDAEAVAAGGLVVLSRPGVGVGVEALEPAEALVLSGEPIGEPVAGQGPFVMNTQQEIREAVQDFTSGRMGRLGPV